MYELCRVRLHAVGPEAARFQDLVLDLRGRGAPVQHQQVELWTDEPTPVRPSPATVIFLENGGGKSVLLKLIFSVLLPGKRKIVGSTDPKLFENFVGPKDVAHVVLEWMHPETGALLVTGKTMAWRAQQISAASENLIEKWYCFRSNETLGLDTLPIVENGRYLTFDAYQRHLSEAQVEDPKLEFHWARSHSDWTERLGLMGIDTELFRYQRAMNVDEGAAVSAFALESDNGFVNSFLSAVLPAEELDALADLVADHADRLAARGNLLQEQAFIGRALELLDPIITTSEKARLSQQKAEVTQRRFQDLAERVVLRAQAEEAYLSELNEAVERTAGVLDRAKIRAANAELDVAELRWTHASLSLDEARSLSAELSKERDATRTRLAAWAATEAVRVHWELAAEARELRVLVEQGEVNARPSLEARDLAARRLVRGLLALAEEAAKSVKDAASQAEVFRDSEKNARCSQQTAVREAATARAEARGLQDKIAEVGTRMSAAINNGLLPRAEGLAQTLINQEESLTRTTREVAELKREKHELDDALGTIMTDLGEARQTEHERRLQAERAAENLNRAHRITRELAFERRLRDLLEGDEVDLLTDAELLRARLAEELSRQERERVALLLSDAHDERARLALTDGELLPPPIDVISACEALAAERIESWPGWEYVAEIPDLEVRRRLVSRHPHLVSGVLLNSSADVERAERLLASREGATVFVGIASTEALRETEAEHLPRFSFALPFDEALFDADAAEKRRFSIEQRYESRHRRLSELAKDTSRDTGLLSRLEEWSREYPPETMEHLRMAHESMVASHAEAEHILADHSRNLEHNERRRSSLNIKIPQSEERLRLIHERTDELRALAKDADDTVEWAAKKSALEHKAERFDEVAERQGALAQDAADQATAYVRTADDHSRTAAQIRQDISQYPGADSVSLDDPPSSEPIPSLRSAYETAQKAFTSAAVGKDLRDRLAAAEKEAANAMRAVQALDPPVLSLAKALLRTAEGVDATTRLVAIQKAKERVTQLEQQLDEANKTVGACENDLRQKKKDVEALTGENREPLNPPRSLEECVKVIHTAELSFVAAVQKQKICEGEHAVAAQRFAAASESAREFRILADALCPSSQVEGLLDPYSGDFSAAKRDHATLSEERTRAVNTAKEDQAVVRAAAGQLIKHSSAEEFSQLGSAVRREINGTDTDRFADEAPRWKSLFLPRQRSLTEELEQTDRHRDLIRDGLRDQVGTALSLLRTAQKVSALPASLDDWEGKEFLQFNFERLHEQLLPDKLGQVLDEAAAGRTADGRKVSRDGLSLVLSGVHAAVPRGFRVYILKPDTVLRDVRAKVSDVKRTFSGGQQLTAAILLYCTMAALRANDRGRKRDRHAGLLFLDNPIGKANADYLLDLQRSVAAALGVQLVYTTGLFDAKALRGFPLIVRLRNDADLRASRKYLSVEPRIRDHLDRLPLPDGTGRLTGARIFNRDEPNSPSAANPP
ncbi:hypothetical protein ACFQ08_00100 [Streptosporangium algeriense]|uniref:Chromosome segregation ATPase n=1 Tax=Streptosporangium algeriense TaxID=1682748 RepID=A0ABW3DJ51_9ACTN